MKQMEGVVGRNEARILAIHKYISPANRWTISLLDHIVFALECALMAGDMRCSTAYGKAGAWMEFGP